MTGIIYCIHYFEGMRILKEIVGDAALDGCKHTRFVASKNKTFVEFENGDIWYILSAKNSARGHRWDYCCIDRNISQEVIEQQILPRARVYHWDSPEAKIPIGRRVSYF
jgi:hypothetical protein